MTDVLTSFFSAIAGAGNEHSFLLGFLSLFISGVILSALIDPLIE